MDSQTATAPAPSAVNLPSSPQRNARAPREDLRSPRRGVRGQRARGGASRDAASRGRGRGRAGRPDEHSETLTSNAVPTVSAVRENASQVESSKIIGNGEAANAEEEDVEAEVCFICASPVIHNSIAPCNHRTCHICALRMRALYKTKACAHCRSDSEFVIFTDDANKRYEDFSESDFAKSDPSLGIKYEKNDIFEDTVLLLRYNCPEESCDIACYGWPDLHRHVKTLHHRIMCDLCTRNKKVFTHEHELFTHPELRKHEKFGDDNPGAIDQSGFKGHPECGFCKQRFYGDDELYTHCRDKHERCHICDRRSASRQQQYYLDYDALEVHFRKDHFLCPDQECLDKKFTVFESEMDLKAHQLEAHPNGLSKDARRDARRVDMSGFDYRQPHQESQRGSRREGRGRGRGRDPNVEALPVSSAQPMRRDELAYQRSLAIHSAQSVSNRTFGSQLTSSDAFAARPPPTANGSGPPTVSAPIGRTSNDARPTSSSNENVPSLQSLNLNQTPNPNQTPAERARQLRHASLIERASNLLSNDQSRLATFRNNISTYRHSAMTAPQLIDSFFALFNTDSSSLGTLVKELADIFEIPQKRDDLLKAWNDWRAINEDYPSLPGLANGIPASGAAGGTGAGGKRILKLKSSTAQSSRSAVSRQSSWGIAATPASSSTSAPKRNGVNTAAFPAMPGAASRSAQNKVAWVTPSASSRASPVPAAAQPFRPPPLNNRPAPAPSAADMFPALPAAQKPGMNVMRPGSVGTPRLREGWSGTSTPSNAWAGGGLGGNLTAAIEAALVEDEADGSKKGKGKGKGKKVVLNWG